MKVVVCQLFVFSQSRVKVSASITNGRKSGIRGHFYLVNCSLLGLSLSFTLVSKWRNIAVSLWATRRLYCRAVGSQFCEMVLDSNRSWIPVSSISFSRSVIVLSNKVSVIVLWKTHSWPCVKSGCGMIRQVICRYVSFFCALYSQFAQRIKQFCISNAIVCTRIVRWPSAQLIPNVSCSTLTKSSFSQEIENNM